MEDLASQEPTPLESWAPGEKGFYIAIQLEDVSGALVKVIFENAYLTDDEKVDACHIAEQAGADFVKTSTGFAPGGATLTDLILMRANVSPAVQVKAAGGVRTLDTLLAMAAEGVTRFGATATATILADATERAERGALTIPARGPPTSVRSAVTDGAGH